MDLWGRLSNPSEIIEKSPDQGWSSPRRPPSATAGAAEGRDSGRSAEPPEQKGRLSNPVQRRLSKDEVREVGHRYAQGLSIDALAREFEVHRTTVIHHLDCLGVPRRRSARKMTDTAVSRAAARYAEGASLAAVAAEFDVHARTLAREFSRAGVITRPRNGASAV